MAEVEKENPHASLMAVNGEGMEKDVMFITFYKDYSAYSDAVSLTKSLPFISLASFESFLVDLNDEDNYRLLTLGQMARHLESLGKISKEETAQKNK